MGRRRRLSFITVAAAFGFLGQLAAPPVWPATLDNALLSPRYTVDDADENQLLGPVFFDHHSTSRLELGMRPLTSFSTREDGFGEADIFYPLFTIRSTPSS